MEMPTLLLFHLILLTLFSSTTLASTPTLLNTALTLMESGYLSMALTLRLASSTLSLHSPTATIFVPSDRAFLHSGQLPLSLLKYHISPRRLTVEDLRNLPPGAPLPTLLSNRCLTVTYSSVYPDQLCINNVTVGKTAIFDNGSVILLPIDEFFNSSSLNVPESVPAPSPSPRYGSLGNGGSGFVTEPFGLVSDFLKSRGCSIMATLLEAELAEFTDGTRFTLFAPTDEAVVENVRNISDYSVIFRRHIVPRLLPWRDLVRLQADTTLRTFSDGFTINVTVSPRVRLLNGVLIAFPDMYRSDTVIVHGLNRLLL